MRLSKPLLLLGVLLMAYALLPCATLTGLLVIIIRSSATAPSGRIAFLFVENIYTDAQKHVRMEQAR